MGWAERQVRTRPARVVVGYPVGGSVTLPFHVSMLQLLSHEMMKPDRERLLAKIQHTQGLYVADNRTSLTAHMLEVEADWLLQIDTDIEFPKTLLESMLAIAGDDKLVLGASVPLGSAQFPTGAFVHGEEAGHFRCLPKINGQVVECDGLATAIILIHRKVLEDIAAEDGQCWFNHLYIPAKPDFQGDRKNFKYISQGEDLAFCIRAQKVGHRIWCAYVHGLKHHKVRAYSHDSERAATMGDDPGVGELVEA